MTSFKEYIPSFVKLLQSVTHAVVSAEAYPQSYFQKLMQDKTYYLHIYAFTLDKLFATLDKPTNEVSLLDFGCGNGMLALFAKHCGIREVTACDVSASFVLAAQRLGKLLNIELDGWVIGDEKTLLKHFAGKQLDAVASTDAIEHVYSIEDLLSSFRKINSDIKLGFTTASVAENPIKSKRLKKLHQSDELTKGDPLHASSEFADLPFVEIRRKLIRDNFIGLNNEEILLLAKRTRGLKEPDIYKAVELYQQEKILPNPSTHPTNTCDPITGSWTERLLAKNEYQKIFDASGFELDFYNGFYNEWQPSAKGAILKMLNRTIEHSETLGEKISPFELLIATPK